MCNCVYVCVSVCACVCVIVCACVRERETQRERERDRDREREVSVCACVRAYVHTTVGPGKPRVLGLGDTYTQQQGYSSEDLHCCTVSTCQQHIMLWLFHGGPSVIIITALLELSALFIKARERCPTNTTVKQCKYLDRIAFVERKPYVTRGNQ